jgi:hypothetical protein
MMRKASIGVALVLLLLVSSSIFAGSVKGRITPAKPASDSAVIGLPAARGIQGLRGSSSVNPRAVEKFYYNPIIFFWDIFEGDAKYKFKAVGSKGGLVKGTIPVNECGGANPAVCEIEAEFPPLAQKWDIKGKAYDAANNKVANILFDPLQTVAPETPILTSPEDGASASSAEVLLEFDFAEGGIEYIVKVKDPADGVTKGKDTYLNLCNEEGNCGVVYATESGDPLASGIYSWKVTAKGAYGKTKSATQTFVIP